MQWISLPQAQINYSPNHAIQTLIHLSNT